MSGQERTHEQRVVELVRCIDHDSQHECMVIRDLCRAVLAELSPDLGALCRVRRLLGLIEVAADSLRNSINATAGDLGANYIDEEERAFRERMHAALKAAEPGAVGGTTEGHS